MSGDKVAVQVVTVEDIVQTIVANGRVEAPQRVNIGSQIIGTVATIPVAEGERFKAHGQRVLAFDKAVASHHLEIATRPIQA